MTTLDGVGGLRALRAVLALEELVQASAEAREMVGGPLWDEILARAAQKIGGGE